MTLNAVGFVQVFDGGSPRLLPGKAMEVISGGEFVYASGADNTVSSGANSYALTDITYSTDASGAEVTGVAVYNVESGASMSVATRGVVIATAYAAVTAGFPVSVEGTNSVANAGSVAGNLAALRNVGRALTSAASGGYCLVHLNV